jgi:hypothetical protein
MRRTWTNERSLKELFCYLTAIGRENSVSINLALAAAFCSSVRGLGTHFFSTAFFSAFNETGGFGLSLSPVPASISFTSATIGSTGSAAAAAAESFFDFLFDFSSVDALAAVAFEAVFALVAVAVSSAFRLLVPAAPFDFYAHTQFDSIDANDSVRCNRQARSHPQHQPLWQLITCGHDSISCALLCAYFIAFKQLSLILLCF